MYLYMDESGLPKLTARCRGVFLTAAIRLGDLGPLRCLFRRIRKQVLDIQTGTVFEQNQSSRSDLSFPSRFLHWAGNSG